MTNSRGKPPGDANDNLRLYLRAHDPVAPPRAHHIASLERSLLARIDALEKGPPGNTDMPPAWMISTTFLTRSAWISGVLVIMLGFFVGRGLDPAAPVASEQPTYFASADDVSWQSFIAGPGMPGDADDTGE